MMAKERPRLRVHLVSIAQATILILGNYIVCTACRRLNHSFLPDVNWSRWAEPIFIGTSVGLLSWRIIDRVRESTARQRDFLLVLFLGIFLGVMSGYLAKDWILGCLAPQSLRNAAGEALLTGFTAIGVLAAFREFLKGGRTVSTG